MRTSGPRTRQLRPDLWQDPAITRLGPWERLLFLGLISLADDEGRFVASPPAIHAHVFPCDSDVQIGLWLEALRKERLIALYRVEGTVYGELRTWRRHQTIKAPRPSKLPPGPFAPQNALGNGELDTEGVSVKAADKQADNVSSSPLAPQAYSWGKITPGVKCRKSIAPGVKPPANCGDSEASQARFGPNPLAPQAHSFPKKAAFLGKKSTGVLMNSCPLSSPPYPPFLPPAFLNPLKNDPSLKASDRLKASERREETLQLPEARQREEGSMPLPPTPQSKKSGLNEAPGKKESGQKEALGRKEPRQQEAAGKKEPEQKEAPGKKEQEQEVVEEVFAYWKEALGLNARTKLTPKRRTRILARLREGYGVERMKRAIDGCAASAYHREHHYTDLELILRSGEKLERFEAMAAAPSPEDESAARAARAAEALSGAASSPAPSPAVPVQAAPPSAGGWSEADWDVVFTLLEGAWPDPYERGLSGAEATVWRKFLAEVPPASVRAALEGMIESGRKRRPRVGEVLAEARRGPTPGVPRFEEAWRRISHIVWATAPARGEYGSPKAKEEAVMAALAQEHPVIAAFAAAAGYSALRSTPPRALRELWEASVRAYVEGRAEGEEG
jgi:hypothetical protein